jgi:hypothetical protein
MFLTLLEDNCVHVYDSPDAAAVAIEPLDVGLVRAAFDQDARPYRVEWIRPNTHGKTLGILPWSVNGEYRFVMAGDSDATGLIAMIRDANGIFPKEEVQAVQELQSRLTAIWSRKSRGRTPERD